MAGLIARTRDGLLVILQIHAETVQLTSAHIFVDINSIFNLWKVRIDESIALRVSCKYQYFNNRTHHQLSIFAYHERPKFGTWGFSKWWEKYNIHGRRIFPGQNQSFNAFTELYVAVQEFVKVQTSSDGMESRQHEPSKVLPSGTQLIQPALEFSSHGIEHRLELVPLFKAITSNIWN